MRWGRRRRGVGSSVSKRHYTPNGSNGVAACKKEFDAAIYTTENILNVTCKTCIKKMVKDGIATLEMFPTWLHPATPVTKAKTLEDSAEFDVNDYKNDYLKRLGVFR